MRIAVTASLVAPLVDPPIGGAQAFVCDLAEALQKRGHEVTVYCSAGSAWSGLHLVEIPVEPGVSAALVRPGGARAAAPVPALREAFSREFEAVRAADPDAVSQHAFDAEAIEGAEDLPVLHTLHLPPQVPAVVEAARASKARFVAVSEAARGAWLEAGLARVGVIRNGVPDLEPPPAAPVEPVALIAGRISPEKGTATALRAASEVGLRPHLVGDVFDHEYWERSVRLASRAMSRPELRRLMAGSAVTLMPIEWDEPFGLVAAEAQLAGCPVAGYRRGGLPEVVEQGVGGLLAEPGDFEGLLEAIRGALRLDRAAVRASALRRLLIGPVAEAYERELGGVAEARRRSAR